MDMDKPNNNNNNNNNNNYYYYYYYYYYNNPINLNLNKSPNISKRHNNN
jgi:hypothetical protein